MDTSGNGVPDECEGEDRVKLVHKGSVLYFPRVELRFDIDGNLIQDTFITIANDYNLSPDVNVQMYFVNGDPRPDLESAGDEDRER